jgi:hypothetical protein
MEQYETIDKFDRAVGGLLAGNNLHTKATTIEEIDKITGQAETFIVQTIRDEDGDHVAGDILISRIAEALVEAGLEAFHNQGDEFICKGGSYAELNRKLNSALEMVRKPFAVRSVDDRVTEFRADFCFGIGTDLKEAEKSVKHQKELLRALRGSQAE